MCLPEQNWLWQSIYDCGFTNLISLHPKVRYPTLLISSNDQPLGDLVSGDLLKNPLLEICKIRSGTNSVVQPSSDSKGVVVNRWRNGGELEQFLALS